MKSTAVQRLILLFLQLTNSRLKKIVLTAIILLLMFGTKKLMSRYKVKTKLLHDDSVKIKTVKGNVNGKFFRKLLKLIKIAVPRLVCRETACLAVLSISLVIRTILSIQISDVSGSIVKAIVKVQFSDFIYKIIILALYSLPSSGINSGLEYLNKKFALYMRENMTKHFHEKYLTKMCFYQITNLDNRITNPDQIFTNDIEKWSNSLSNLYNNFSKPLLDIVLFTKKLSETIGYEGPLLMIGWFFLTGFLIKYVSPPFGKLTAIEQTLEGEFRACHSGLISHSEEIAFYRGNEWEKERVNGTFKDLFNHISNVYEKRFFMGIIESMLVKYGATLLGFSILGLPVFGKRSLKYTKDSGRDASNITKDYIRNSSLLINLAKAIGRIVVSYKDLQNLSGYTFLVRKLDKVVEEINKGNFVRTQVNEKVLESYISGEEKESDIIEFNEVPIITPNGDILCEKISFKIEKGNHTFITGPNGCGKSSLFRILGNLWPLYGGVLKKPKMHDIFYIPQRPYLPAGTLRDQVIYPMSLDEFNKSGKKDEDINKLFEAVSLDTIRSRFSAKGYDTVRDWNDVLSGGEKQRIAMARLFFHCPKYAILDECTSAVSIEVEGKMYNYAKSMGITLITVSHRPSLYKYHKYLIKFLADGKFQFEEILENNN